MQQGCNIFSVNDGTNNNYNYSNTPSYSGAAAIKPYDPDLPTFSLNNVKPPEEVWKNADYPFTKDRDKLIMNKETSDSNTPRPPNSFMIYANNACKKQKYEKMNARRRGKLIAIDWKNEPEEVRYIFECGAEVAKKEHAKKYKDYKYKKRNQKNNVKKNESVPSLMPSTSILSSEQLQYTNYNTQMSTPTMEESEESYQSDGNIPLDSGRLFNPVSTTSINDISQALTDLYQLENIESNSPITEELQFNENSTFDSPQLDPTSTPFFSPTSSIEPNSITPVNNFSQYDVFQPENYSPASNIIGPGYHNCDQNETSIEPNSITRVNDFSQYDASMETPPQNYFPVVSNINGPGYLNCDQSETSISSNTGLIDLLTQRSFDNHQESASDFSNLLMESYVQSTTAVPNNLHTLNKPNNSTELNNLSGLVIGLTGSTLSQIAGLTPSQIEGLNRSRITQLVCKQLTDLPHNQITVLVCNQITELVCSQIQNLVYYGI
ncbi:hypothetical protein RclHR1_00950017 [Rhizophagus clarus]|uniref:HMG box domain-containing protein n=1 Tax=Rhizophagus clarus TaxID=94130 RepID=A0A2Z6SHT1_9GLOM|nr:hypothetical protein RclHR1_00950017 [Rhizophagus clarus]GES74672.1 hypothetical protein RCL_jg10248.t1 [Rhizophagus clarus]